MKAHKHSWFVQHMPIILLVSLMLILLASLIKRVALPQRSGLLPTIPVKPLRPVLVPRTVQTPCEPEFFTIYRFPPLHLRQYLVLKRWLDIVVSATLLVLFAPLMLVIAVLVKLDSSGPVIFAQERIGANVRGKGGKRSWEVDSFTIYKFRTMYHNVDSERHRTFVQALIKKDEATLTSMQGGKLVGDKRYKMRYDPRITRIGRFLRKTSLDELPQLWNVLKGDMSLVGPRPPLSYEVDVYTPSHLRRLAAKPGLTGVWQVTSRSSVSFDEMVELDAWYIDHQSLWLDLEILFKTPVAVLAGKGAA